MIPALDAAGQAIFWSAIAGIGALLCGGVIFLTRDGREERIWAEAEPEQPDLADVPDPDWALTRRLAAWARVKRPRVMADPVRTWMIDLALAARPVAVRRDGPLNVSGPAAATVSPSTAAVRHPPAEAGPETPHPVTSDAGNHRPAATAVTSLPPVDQAAHLQPIDWRDTTGSFTAACAGDYR